MALFKISKGFKANLPEEKTAGYCWYTIDDSLFYIDYEDENGVVQRKALNAKEAETLSGKTIVETLNDSTVEIPTSSAVFAAIGTKLDDVTAATDSGIRAIKTGNTVAIEIDESITWIFDCGTAADV